MMTIMMIRIETIAANQHNFDRSELCSSSASTIEPTAAFVLPADAEMLFAMESRKNEIKPQDKEETYQPWELDPQSCQQFL